MPRRTRTVNTRKRHRRDDGYVWRGARRQRSAEPTPTPDDPPRRLLPGDVTAGWVKQLSPAERARTFGLGRDGTR